MAADGAWSLTSPPTSASALARGCRLPVEQVRVLGQPVAKLDVAREILPLERRELPCDQTVAAASQGQ